MPDPRSHLTQKRDPQGTVKSLRTFVAIPISQSLLHNADGGPSELAQVMAELRTMAPAVRVIDATKMHVTVKFLGDTRVSDVPEVLQRMSDVAGTVSASAWTLQGLGVFPNLSHPRVVWAGLTPTAVACEIAAALETRLKELGFPLEGRTFKPHVTLGYIKARPPRSFEDLLKRHQQTIFGIDRFSQIELMESTLLPSGSEYRLIQAAPFSNVPQ